MSLIKRKNKYNLNYDFDDYMMGYDRNLQFFAIIFMVKKKIIVHHVYPL